MGKVGKGIVVGLGAWVACTVGLIVIGANARNVDGVGRATRDSVPYILGKLADAVRSATVEDDRELTYSYNVPAVRNGRYDGAQKREAERQIREAVCDDRMMRKALDGGATINYAYRDANGTRMFTIMVSKRTCWYVG